MPRISPRTAVVAAVAAATLAAASSASAATPGNPQVLKVNPATSAAPAVVAGGSPWTNLEGISIAPDDTLFVANQGDPGPSPVGSGLYSLANANTAPLPSLFSSFSTGGSQSYPQSVVAGASTVYEIDSDAIVAIDRATGTRTTLSSGQLFDSADVAAQFGAISGNTLYVTADSSCQSAEGGTALVIGVDLTTGKQTQVADLSCAALGGIAVEQAGTLLVVETSTDTNKVGNVSPTVVRVDPATGQVSKLGTGADQTLLKAPQGIAYAGPSNAYVADAQAGIVQVNPTTGHQFSVRKPGAGSPLGNAYGITQDATGTLYVSEAGVAPTLKASAKSQKPSSSVAFTGQCNRTCTIGYSLSLNTRPSYAQTGTVSGSAKKQTLKIRIGSSVAKRIAANLKKGKKTTATVTLTPQDPNSGAPGTSTKLTIRFVK